VPVKEIDSGYFYEERRRLAFGVERFDRVQFALRALSILRPRGMKVAVYQGRFDVRVETGRNFGAGPEATWAMVGIPPHASREHIAVALAELAGVASMPYVIDLLVHCEDVQLPGDEGARLGAP
jgi:hypothetical protein